MLYLEDMPTKLMPGDEAHIEVIGGSALIQFLRPQAHPSRIKYQGDNKYLLLQHDIVGAELLLNFLAACAGLKVESYHQQQGFRKYKLLAQ